MIRNYLILILSAVILILALKINCERRRWQESADMTLNAIFENWDCTIVDTQHKPHEKDKCVQLTKRGF